MGSSWGQGVLGTQFLIISFDSLREFRGHPVLGRPRGAARAMEMEFMPFPLPAPVSLSRKAAPVLLHNLAITILEIEHEI